MTQQNPFGSWDWEALLLGNDPVRWTLALAAAATVFLFLRLVLALISNRLRRFAASTDTDIDDTISGLVDRTSVLALLALSLVVGSRTLDLPPRVEGFTARLAGLLFLLQGAIWVSFAFQDLVLRAVARREKQGELPRSVTTLISVAGRLVVWSVTLLIALETIGYDATALVTGLGIGGVAIGLALQGILKDLFAFLAIVLDRPFAVGDSIAIGELVGTVEKVGIKTTRLRALSGEELVFGNHDLLSSRVRNFHDVESRRIVIKIGVLYDTPPSVLQEIPEWLRECLDAVSEAIFQRCFLVGLADSSIDFELVATVDTSIYNDFLGAKQGTILAVLRRLEENNVQLAFPTRTVVLEGALAESTPVVA